MINLKHNNYKINSKNAVAEITFNNIIIVVFGLVSSCSEQENVKELVVETNKSKAVLYMDAGKMHNDILEMYELEELKTGALYSRRNVSDLKNMIQVIDVYLKSIGSDVLFSDVLKEDIILQSNILQLIGAGYNLKSLQQVLLANDAGEMTNIFTEYSSKIIQLFENHKDFIG